MRIVEKTIRKITIFEKYSIGGYLASVILPNVEIYDGSITKDSLVYIGLVPECNSGESEKCLGIRRGVGHNYEVI
jgi:hypothetical protein